MQKSIKILICCHKNTPRINNEIFKPILLGSMFADETLRKEFEYDFQDSEGDNIAKLHPYCAELTAIYWAWKNYNELGNPEYIGLFHYRRFFNFKREIPEKDSWKCAFFDFNTESLERFGWDKDTIINFCNGADLILPHKEQILDPMDWKTPATLEIHYKHSHYPEDLDRVCSYIKDHIPDYKNAVDEALNAPDGYFCNMFIMTRKNFFEYAQWLFSIILPISNILQLSDSKYDNEQKRVLGFLGERLFNIWITQKIKYGIKIRETQRLTGYLDLPSQETFIRNYGKEFYQIAKYRSHNTINNHIFDKTINERNVIIYPLKSTIRPKVSILVAVYNIEKYLKECLDSLLKQTLKDIEIICVDNASTDSSLSILFDYYQRDPRVTIIEHKKNEGLPGSRNTALRYLNGKYFSFVDGDDICDPQMFEKLYDKAEKLDADIVTCSVKGFYESLDNQYFHRPLEWYGESDKLLPLSMRPQQLMEPAAWCKLFKTAYIKQLDYFEFRDNTCSWEDVPAMTSAFIQTNRIATVQEALYFYRQRSSGNLSSNMGRRHIDDFISGVRKQQEILSNHEYTDELVNSYIEEFKLLFAEWVLSKINTHDIPYFFHHVGKIFKLRDKKYLERVFSQYPKRKKLYFIIKSRSAAAYWSGKKVYGFLKNFKSSIKKTFNIKRVDVYWTLHKGPFRVMIFRRKYYEQTISWYNGTLHELKSTSENLLHYNNMLCQEKKDLANRVNKFDREIRRLRNIEGELTEQIENLNLEVQQYITENKKLSQEISCEKTSKQALIQEKQALIQDKQALIQENQIVTLQKQSYWNDIQSFKQEFDGFYHAVWNTGWVNVWKRYYWENYSLIQDKIEQLKGSMDYVSLDVIDRQCYRMFRLLPMQEDSNLFRYDHQHIYTKEELEGASEMLDESVFRNKYCIPENEHLEVSVFKFKCGLTMLPDNITQQIKGRDIIDGGAYWGDSALIFSEYSPNKIYSFEPQPETFEKLLNTIKKNGLGEKIIPEQFGLGITREIGNLYTKGMASGANLSGIEPVVSAKDMQVDEVQITSIDEFSATRNLSVGLIKLDIEGNELDAIKGAVEVIKRDKPILAISIYHTPKDFFEIKPLIDKLNLGYKFMVRKLVYHDLVSEIMLLGYVE